MNQIALYIASHAKTKETALTGREIGNAFMVSDSDVRRRVNEARCDGVPICSNKHGYYYSEKSDDIINTVKHLKSRISKVECAIDGLNGII